MSKNREPTSCPKRTIWTGIASIFNLAGTAEFNEPKSDEEALKNDWEMIGEDFRSSMKILTKIM